MDTTTRQAPQGLADQRHTPEELTPAIDQLTLEHDREPSLLDQLRSPMGVDSGRSASAPGSRPPAATANLALVLEIEQQSAETAQWLSDREHRAGGRPGRNPWQARPTAVRDNLRLIALLAPNSSEDQGAMRIEWVGRVVRWCARARSALGQASPLRGVPCIDCRAAIVTVDDGGWKVQRPALTVYWSPDAHHFVQCGACWSWRWASDLHAIAENQRALALAQELQSELP